MSILATKQLTQDSANQGMHRYSKQSPQALYSMRSPNIPPLSTSQPLLQRQCACGGGCPRCLEKEGVIQRQALLGTATNLLDSHPASEQHHKPELEFNSALHFNRTFSGFNPTGPPKEGDPSVIWWKIWNTGWETAPEHMNRLTIYNADLCSGCRNEKDMIFRSEISAPSIVSGTQPGKSDYENSVLISGLPVGNYDAYVELDTQNQVEEINEDNNVNFLTFRVNPNNESEP